jgi:hypothetical protein
VSLALVDHLVVAAHSLVQGVAWCEKTLGVTPGPGGRHVLMGTHNRLLKVATESYPKAYLEIIAIDPDAPPPGRARWFGLDDMALQEQLREAPRLVHVVARTTLIDMHRAGLLELGLQPGDPVRASRDTPLGPLSWQILVRADGALDCGGALPTLMQWDGRHPGDAMADSDVRLRSLRLSGLPERARLALGLRGVAVSPGPGPAVCALLDTPQGEITLSSA